MNKLPAIWLLSIIFQAVLLAQPREDDPEDTFNDALYFYNIEDYTEAAYLFQKLLRNNPENANFNFYTGMSLLNVKGQERQAIAFLERAVMNTTLKYKQKRFNERRAPHHAWFYLGNAYRVDNQLDKALDSYEKFQNIKDFEKRYNIRIVENEIKACNRAKIIQDSPLRIRFENPGSPINTEAAEYNPVLSADENSIIFISSHRFYEAIFYSRKSGGTWSPPVNITSQIGSDGDMFPCFLSADGKELYLVKKSRSGGDIYVSRLEGEFWTTAQALNKNINSRSNESHASLSPDGNILLFTSDRRGGYGGLDIYYCIKQADGEWGPAINMGNVINTAMDEDTPFFSPDGNKLYFSSMGHFNMGGFDIFFSIQNADGNWGHPINIGYPINTTGDDNFFYPVVNEYTGYMAKYDEENGLGQEDIFKIEVLPYTSFPDKPDTYFDRDFNLEINDKESGEIIEIIYDTKSNKLEIKTNNPGKNYSIKIKDK